MNTPLSLPDAIRAASYHPSDFPSGLEVLQRASVLLPLIEKEDGWHLLFEQRAQNIDVQPGDICFPGGHTEENEDALETVLRECTEELLLEREQIRIIRQLPEILGPRHTIVTPFAAVLHQYTGGFDVVESDRVFTVPLAFFQTNAPRIHRSPAPPPPEDFPYFLIRGGKNYPFERNIRETFFYEYDGTVIWGFTAKLIRLLLEIIA